MNINNFWETCKRELDYHPVSPCYEENCSWRIISKDYNNCFWTYIRENSRPDGTMKPLLPQEIAKLFGIPTAKMNEEIELAEDAMRILLYKQDYVNIPDSISEDIGPIIEPADELEDQDAFDIIIEDV